MAACHRGPLPLLITDVVMPGFSGRILAERLAAARPEIKCFILPAMLATKLRSTDWSEQSLRFLRNLLPVMP